MYSKFLEMIGEIELRITPGRGPMNFDYECHASALIVTSGDSRRWTRIITVKPVCTREIYSLKDRERLENV